MITNPFEMALNVMLQERAKSDPLFAETLKKPNKSISECAKYIYGELCEIAKKAQQGNTAVIAIADGVDSKFEGTDDVLSLAVHYYDEDNIEIKPVSPAVKANVSVGKKKSEDKGETKKTTATTQPKQTNKPKPKPNPLLESIKKEKKAETKKAEKKAKIDDFCGSLFDF